ncbi:MAG: 50S ribosomal protein L35 [Alphaproteobacteria bacterium]|nr:50S ribosomal protein L35 [Alphaproteobacteria bacterium]
MSKMKTHSGAKKRFKLTAKGKVKFKHAKMRHINEHMPKTTKRKLRHAGTLDERDAKLARRLLGVGG